MSKAERRGGKWRACSYLIRSSVAQFNKEPGKVVDEFKLRVIYVPASPPSPVAEEPEEESSPKSSAFENSAQSLQTNDSVVKASEPSKEKSLEALAMISKLTEEKNSAIQHNQKLRQDLEMLRKEHSRQHGGFNVTFVVLVGLLDALIGLLGTSSRSHRMQATLLLSDVCRPSNSLKCISFVPSQTMDFSDHYYFHETLMDCVHYVLDWCFCTGEGKGLKVQIFWTYLNRYRISALLFALNVC